MKLKSKVIEKYSGDGSLEVVKFDKFISELQEEKLLDHVEVLEPLVVVKYNNPMLNDGDPGPIKDYTYVPLVEGEGGFKASLMHQADIMRDTHSTAEDMLEAMFLKHLYNFGSPGSKLVMVGKRCAMIAQPEDFIVFKSGDRKGLVCLNKPRTRVWMFDEGIEEKLKGLLDV